MKKIIIASYKDQAGELLEAIQHQGIMEVLDANRALVSKQWPQLQSITERPRQIEERLEKLEQAIVFLNEYTNKKGGLAAALAPRAVIDQSRFVNTVGSDQALHSLEHCLQLQKKMDGLKLEAENISAQIQHLLPWEKLTTPLQEIDSLQTTAVLAGFLSGKNLITAGKELRELAVIEHIGRHNNSTACVIACFKENLQDVHKVLRGLEFEAVNFTGIKGVAAELIKENRQKVVDIKNQLTVAKNDAKKLSEQIIDLQILADYYRNILSRHTTQRTSPQSEQVVIFEGWVKKHDYAQLKKIVKHFDASSISEMPIKKDEDIPVEIDNNPLFRPFEVITRLYGMPHSTSVDPTVFLAPFFAIFLGLCISDVGYGLILAVAFWWLGRKMQAGKQVITLFLICSFTTILFGFITGSWFADTITALIPAQGKTYSILNGIREKFLLIDPMSQPINFILLTLAIGYFQMMFGFCIALTRNLMQKNFVAAICDQFVWLVFYNNFLVIGLTKCKVIPAGPMNLYIVIAIICAIMILLTAVREGAWGSRIGMGAFQLFSAVFFVGDTLSYVRLMALGMVGAGLGMAINVLVKMLMDVPYVGFFLAAILFVAGHTFNVALSLLGAFVHSMRLQFIEFFPKFFSGGGTDFRPLTKEYKHIMIKE